MFKDVILDLGKKLSTSFLHFLTFFKPKTELINWEKQSQINWQHKKSLADFKEHIRGRTTLVIFWTFRRSKETSVNALWLLMAVVIKWGWSEWKLTHLQWIRRNSQGKNGRQCKATQIYVRQSCVWQPFTHLSCQFLFCKTDRKMRPEPNSNTVTDKSFLNHWLPVEKRAP